MKGTELPQSGKVTEPETVSLRSAKGGAAEQQGAQCGVAEETLNWTIGV